jgi:NAD(P)H-dependent FMN reductase
VSEVVSFQLNSAQTCTRQVSSSFVLYADPLEIPFPLMSKPLHHYPDPSQAPAWLVAAGKKIQEADAYVFVSAEYNHSIPPALSNMADHFPLTYFAFKPSAIVCYSMGKCKDSFL